MAVEEPAEGTRVEEPGGQTGRGNVRYAAWGTLAVAAIAAAIWLPIWLWCARPRFIDSTYGGGDEVFELAGFTASAVLAGIAVVRLWKRRGVGWQELVPVLAPLAVVTVYLYPVTETARVQPWDYRCYEQAAARIIAGENPYDLGEYFYRYPPLTARVLAKTYRATGWAYAATGYPQEPTVVWWTVYYLYQCGQLLSIAAAYGLCFWLARDLGLPRLRSHVLVTALLIFNNPLLRTVHHCQVNIWTLNAALLGVLLTMRAAFPAGLSIGLAVHIKVYPLMLVAAQAAARRWRAVLWSCLACAAILLVQTSFARDWAQWQQFLTFIRSFPAESHIRNTSPQVIAANTFRLVGGVDPAQYPTAFSATIWTVSVLLGATFIARLVMRERCYRRHLAAGAPAPQLAGRLRLYGHAADALAFGLLLSPSVWEHHYVLTLPLAIFAAAARGADVPWRVAIAAALIFAVPTFDFYPLSYHRIVGLLMLLVLTRPPKVLSQPIPA